MTHRYTKGELERNEQRDRDKEREREMQEYVVHSWGHGKKGWAVTNLYKR